jgi:PIN domain nuclease of toxin-antitoxin system
VTTVLLDSHVIYWWSAEPKRLSRAAIQAMTAADQLAVASITWFELARMAHTGSISVAIPVRSWLEGLAAEVRTAILTPAIADTASTLPDSFPGDPADRLIYATAIEHGWPLITKDWRLRRHSASVAVW